ncbi:MAG TPA: hypothetical protein VE422_30730 [Terriglobia bacterium]|nr:hypothetical protein [Terriglobia bacterium]
MHGTFSGLPLKQIIAVMISKDAPGIRRTAFRVLGGANPKLEERLHLGDEATLILSSSEIDGRIVAFQGDVHHGYEITIELKKSAGE